MPKPFPTDFAEQAQNAYEAISMQPVQGRYVDVSCNGCCPLTAVALANNLIEEVAPYEMDTTANMHKTLAEALDLQLGEVQAFIEAYDYPMSNQVDRDTVVAQQAIQLAETHYNDGEPY